MVNEVADRLHRALLMAVDPDGLVLLKIHYSLLTAESPSLHKASSPLLAFEPSPSSWSANSLTWRMWTPNYKDPKGIQGPGCKTKIAKLQFQEDARLKPKDENDIEGAAAPAPLLPRRQ